MEEKLASGMSQVWRKGDAVLRETRPWSATAHRLLRHLRENGFCRCPEFLGMTEDGREALSFVPGRCIDDYPESPDPLKRERVAFEMGRLTRALHDASASFPRTDADRWMLACEGEGEPEVICHNDLGAYNVCFEEGLPTGLIDFDACCPAPRRWDLVYAAYRFAPLSHSAYDPAEGRYREYDPARDDADRARAVSALYAGYGFAPLADEAETCARRLTALADYIAARAKAGDPAFARMLREGHRDLYLADARLLRERGALWFSARASARGT